MKAPRRFILPCFLFAALALWSAPAGAQTTAFTYQGSLAANGNYANGTYSFQFALFDNSAGGAQVGMTQTATGVSVTNGTFNALLDFGANAFTGANRWLEVSVKGPSDAGYTPLAPRHQLASAPYSIRAATATAADNLSSACAGCVVNTNISSVAGNKVTGTVTNTNQLGGIAAVGYVLTGDARLSDARPPTAGSGFYVGNGTTQQSASFNISGNGTVGGAFIASSTGNVLFIGQSNSTIGSWFNLNNTSTGGHSWNVVSSGSGNGEGAGKLLFNDQTSGGTRMTLDGTGATVNGSLTLTGALNATLTTANFPTLPHAKARQTSIQSLPNGSFVGLRLDETQFGSGVTFDNANDRLVIVTPGVYEITGELVFSSNGTGIRYLTVNTTSGEVAAVSTNALSGIDTVLNATGLTRLNAGDLVFMTAAQGSGANLNTSVFNGRSASLSVHWVSP